MVGLSDVEAYHHELYYPPLEYFFNGAQHGRLFFHPPFVPPGRRPSDRKRASPLELEKLSTLFTSVNAFAVQCCQDVLPDYSVSLTALSDLLYRLLCCCLPTTHGGFTGDTLLLGGGNSVYMWAECIANLVECIDKLVAVSLKNTPCDTPLLSTTSTPLKDALVSDLLDSVVQTLAWKVFQFRGAGQHTSAFEHSFAPPKREESPLFSRQFRPTLLEIVRLDALKLLAGTLTSADVDMCTLPNTPKKPEQLPIQPDEWQFICVSTTSRPLAPLVRLLAVLTLRFFSRQTLVSKTRVLSPWIELAEVLTWDLWRLQLACSDDEHRSKNDILGVRHYTVDEDLEAGLITGLLIETLRGIQALLTLHNDLPGSASCFASGLGAVLESLTRLRFCPVKCEGVSKVVMALRTKQVNLLYELVCSVYAKIRHLSPNAFLDSFFQTANNLYLYNPSAFTNEAMRENLFHQIVLGGGYPRLTFTVEWRCLMAAPSCGKVNQFSDARLSSPAAAQFIAFFDCLARPLIRNFSILCPAASAGCEICVAPIDSTIVLDRFLNGNVLSLSVLASSLAATLDQPPIETVLSNFVSQLSPAENLNAPEVYLVLVLFRGYLIAEREPPSQLSCAALDVIRKALSATSAISLDMRYFLLDTYLCSVKRHLSLHFDSNTSFEDTEETNLRFTLSFLQNLFTEISNVREVGLIHFYMFIFRTAAQCMAENVCNCSKSLLDREIELNQIGTVHIIPTTTQWAVAELGKMCAWCLTDANDENKLYALKGVLLSILVTEAVLPILNDAFLYLSRLSELCLNFLLSGNLSTACNQRNGVACDSAKSSATLDTSLLTSLDPTAILHTLFPCSSMRYSAMNALWESLGCIFETSLDTMLNDLVPQMQLAKSALLPQLLLLELFLIGEEENSNLIGVSLPSQNFGNVMGEAAWNTESVSLSDLPMEYSAVQQNGGGCEIERSCVPVEFWFGKQCAGLCVTEETTSYACDHRFKDCMATSDDAEKGFLAYLKTQFSTLMKATASTFRHTPGMYLWQQRHDQEWLTRVGRLCPICLYPMPVLRRIGLKGFHVLGASSDFVHRFEKLPPFFRLLTGLAGTSSVRPLVRKGEVVYLSVSSTTLARASRSLVASYYSVSRRNNLPLCWQPSASYNEVAANFDANGDSLSDTLIALLLFGGERISSVFKDLLPLVQRCLQSETQMVHYERMPLCYAISRKNQLDSAPTLQSHICAGRALLLHTLESFQCCFTLLGLSLIQLKRVTGLHTFGSSYSDEQHHEGMLHETEPSRQLSTHSKISHLATPLACFVPPAQNTSPKLNFILETRWIQRRCTLPLGCLFPCDFQHPALIVARRLVDQLRVLLTVPYAPENIRSGFSLKIGSSWEFRLEDAAEKLFSACDLFKRYLQNFSNEENTPRKNSFGVNVGQLTQNLHEIVTLVGPQEGLTSSFPAQDATRDVSVSPQRMTDINLNAAVSSTSWIPPAWSIPLLARGLTLQALSNIVMYWICLLRRALKTRTAKHGAPNVTPPDLIFAILLDALTRATRSLGLSHFPLLLTLLDTRSLLTFLASSASEGPCSQHINLILWWYGLLSRKFQGKLLHHDLLAGHLVRVSYHPLGRRTMHHIERCIGLLISEAQRGLMVVTNCSSWLSRNFLRTPFMMEPGSAKGCIAMSEVARDINVTRLRDAWDSVTKQLVRLSSKKGEASEVENKFISEDMKRSEAMLRASTETQLLLREMWDLTGPDAVLHLCALQSETGPSKKSISVYLLERQLFVLENRIRLISQGLCHQKPESPNSTTSNSSGCLTLSTDTFFQMWEMLRYLWTLDKNVMHELESSPPADIDCMMAKTFRAIEPSCCPFLFTTRISKLDGGAVQRTAALLNLQKLRTNEDDSAVAWRVCRTVQLYLALLGRDTVLGYEVQAISASMLVQQHIALTVTLLSALSDALVHLEPSGTYDCWLTLIGLNTPSTLYIYFPAIVRRLLVILSKGDGELQNQLGALLKNVIRAMREVEMNLERKALSRLSIFCETSILYRAPQVYRGIMGPDSDSDVNTRRLALGLLEASGPALQSQELSLDVKAALLDALKSGFLGLGCSSLIDLHERAGIPFPSNSGEMLLNSCLRITALHPTTHRTSKRPIARLAGTVLGLCGAISPCATPPTFSPRHVWWDSCHHFLAVRVIEHLMYPNLDNRVSLYFIQELLQYLDAFRTTSRQRCSAIDSANGSASTSANCPFHDHPGTRVSIGDFLSENVKRLSDGLKSARYTLSVPHPDNLLRTAQTLHPLQRLANSLLGRLSAEDKEVFLRSGVQFSSYLPDVLRFLLPHLFLSVIASVPEDDEHTPTAIAEETVGVLKCASRSLSVVQKHTKLDFSPQKSTESFALYDPTTTCQIIFEAVDALAQLLFIFLNLDNRTLPALQEASQRNVMLYQSIALTLPRHTWLAIRHFLRLTRGYEAAVAAVQSGAYSRCVFYLESTFFRNRVPYGSSFASNDWTTENAEEFTEAEGLIPLFVEAYRGLEDWENIRGCFRIGQQNDKSAALRSVPEQLALDLQSQDRPVETAWEYSRLAQSNPARNNEFSCKALRALLDGHAFGVFFLEYSRAPCIVKAACVPLLVKALWRAGMWDMLEHVYLKYADAASPMGTGFDVSVSDADDLLNAWSKNEPKRWPKRICFATENAACYSRYASDGTFSLLNLPPTNTITEAATRWSGADKGDFLMSGVLSAMHRQDNYAVDLRLNRVVENAVSALATTACESYMRSYAALVPLHIALDVQRLTHFPNVNQKTIIDRVNLLVQSPRFLTDVLATLKVACEELHMVPEAAALAIRLNKVIRKTTTDNVAPTSNLVVVPPVLSGKHQLTDFLRLLSKENWSGGETALIKRHLSAELSKCVPFVLRPEMLAPLIDADDKLAVQYAKLSVSSTHLLPEKLRTLQTVVQSHPTSEAAHRCLAELLDAQINAWMNRVCDSARRKSHLKAAPPQSAVEDLPNFPKGWSMVSLVETAICHHLEGAAWASSTQQARFHLLKFLQLLVDVFFCDLRPTGQFSRERYESSGLFTEAVQELFVDRVLRLIQQQLARIPASHWYLGVSQIVARCEHKQLGPQIFQPLLARLLLHTPQQMAWHLGPLFCAERNERRETASLILTSSRSLGQRSQAEAQTLNCPELYIERTVGFISRLISLATTSAAGCANATSSTDSGGPRSKISVLRDVPELARVISPATKESSVPNILLPLLSQLDATPEQLEAAVREWVVWHRRVIESNPITITGIDDTILVMRSKQRPKRLTLRGSNGRDYAWLVKRESRGDLRKDARLMEVAGYVNGWIEKVEKARQKKLKIRRYSVIPLNEVTGLIEWLPHLVTLRCAVLELWEGDLGQDKFMSWMKKIIARSNRHKNDPQALLSDYRETLNVFKPVLQRFFFDRFGLNVAMWYSSRKMFCESLASWSILGFILGLGDRHGENILLDILTGQVVHVDFDCLFGKGLQLPVPEIVPFRLTQNLVAALGFGGLRGGFVSACGEIFRTLKHYQTDFLSILQSFIFDPLIEWTRVGKGGASQPQEDDYISGGVRARGFLEDIEVKLNGGVNFRSQRLLIPAAAKLQPPLQPASNYAPSTLTSPTMQSTMENIYNFVTAWIVEPVLDVDTQVNELTEAACCERNLSLMYLGWMPWV